MRTPKIPSYRLHKASGQAVVTLVGKDHYLGKYGTIQSRQEYAILVGEFLGVQGKAVPPALRTAVRPKNISLVEAADRYLEWSKSHPKPAEQSHVKGMLKVALKLYRHEQAANIGPAELREIRRAMVAQN